MTIPANTLVTVNPSVISAGGQGLDVIALVITQNTRVPIGTVAAFASASAVSSYFGAASAEAAIAAIYFQGYDGSTKKPASLLFAQFPIATPVGAYLRGGNISTLTLAQLQALSGTLSVTINGVVQSGTPNLAAATSFSNAAVIINSALGISGPVGATITGSIGGTTLNVSAILTGGPINVGMVVSGTAVPANTYIVQQLSGPTGGAGTYQLSASGGIGASTITLNNAGITYDSVSGAFVVVSPTTGATSTIGFGSGTIASGIKLDAADGAVTSQGSGTMTVATFMNGVIAVNTNWVTFMNVNDPDVTLATGSNTSKQAFAAWKNTQNQRYAYVCADTDATPTTTVPATTSLGQILAANGDNGTYLQYEPSDLQGDAFICGAAASIDFDQTNGRITFAYKWQAGLTPGVTGQTVASNLIANGYNFGGVYGAANENFTWEQNGQVTGAFNWFDSYIDQIWLNNNFQLALLTLLGNVGAIPYDTAGNSLIEQALADPITAGLNFGAFAPGSISAAQAAEVNAQAGTSISDTLQTQGYYLQVLPATSAVRSVRGSPPINFWYLDRGAVQLISMGSVAVE